jgi:hypothetical protein
VEPFVYQVHDSDFPEPGALGRAYEVTAQRIESKAAAAILAAAMVGVAAFHLGGIGSTLGLIRLPVRRRTWHDALFLVGGLQIFLIAIALLLSRAVSVWPTVTEVEFLREFLLSPRTLLVNVGRDRLDPVYIDIINIVLLALLLLAPIGIARRYAPRLGRKSSLVLWGTSLNPFAMYLLVLADIVMLTSFCLAAYVADEVQPRKRPTSPFSMQSLSCALQSNSGRHMITGTVVLRASATDVWDFDVRDFELIVSAQRVASDGPPSKRAVARRLSSRVFVPDRIIVSYSTISPALGAPPFLLQAGQAALTRFEAELSPAAVTFFATHPDEQRCTLAYLQDYPIGAIGIIQPEK